VLITWLIIDVNSSEVDIMIAEGWLELSKSILRPTKSLYSRIQCTAHYFCFWCFIFVRVSKIECVKKTNSRPLKFDINVRYAGLRPQKHVTSPVCDILLTAS
jgi:hypothetical protein